MFIIEKLKADYDARVERWEQARVKYVQKQEYYYTGEYEERHPRPGYWVKSLARATVGFVLVCLAVFLLFGLITGIKVQDEKRQKEEAVQIEDKNCRRFNKDDYVRIQDGDYYDLRGVIVGGCEKDQDYQVKLDKDSKTVVYGDNTPGETDVSGNIVSIDTYKDLVKIEDKKE